jgi:8-oxo-dGTP diphosphatase
MPHIHTKPGEYDHTASAFVVRFVNGVPKLILHFHKKLYKYLQYGGHIETTESPWEAVIHELKEESGYLMSQLKILQPPKRMDRIDGVKVHPQPLNHVTHVIKTPDLGDKEHFHTDISYAFVTDQLPAAKVDEGESQDYILLSREELENFPADKTTESIRAAGLFIFDVCLKEWEEVHPATFD